MDFTILATRPLDSAVRVKFSVDDKVQDIANAPIDDAEALQAFLSDYGRAYVAGISDTSVTPDPTIPFNKIIKAD